MLRCRRATDRLEASPKKLLVYSCAAVKAGTAVGLRVGSGVGTGTGTAGMQDGDFAGLGLLQKRYGLIGVRVAGDRKSLVMISAESDAPVELASVPLEQPLVHLRAACDFRDRADKAWFAYSLDGETWTPLGERLQMAYTLPHFMGYRFALFNYATKAAGGQADFDFLRISGEIAAER